MSETGDWRELIRECRAIPEKGAKGWTKLEKATGAQRYPIWYVSSFGEVQKQRQDTGPMRSGMCEERYRGIYKFGSMKDELPLDSFQTQT